MTVKRKAVAILLFLIAGISLFAATGYSIEELSSDITVSPTGVYEVAERIVMDFSQPLHGFYRVLPVHYAFEDSSRQDIRVRVTKIKASDTLSVTRGGDYLSIRVGDADRTVVGRQEYAISYHYDIGSDTNDGYDEFYFNIVGEDWEVPIKDYSFSIRFPKPIARDSISFSRGYWGSTTAEGVTWNLSADKTVLSGHTTVLNPGEAVTVRVEMPDGYFVERTDWQAYYRIGLLVVSLLLVGVAYIIWFRYGRDKDLIVVPNHEPPEGMSPMDAGYVIDESLDPRDVTSMIFHWADKGCLTIVEEGKDFSFIKGHDPKGASRHEQQLFKDFFANGSNGIVKAKDLKGSFYRDYQKLKGTVSRFYRGERALSSVKSRNMAVLSMLFMVVPSIGFALSTTGNYPGGATLFLSLLALAQAVSMVAIWHLMFRLWHIRRFAGKLLWMLILLTVLVGGWVVLAVSGWIVDSPLDDVVFATTVTVLANSIISMFSIITKQRSAYGRKVLEQVLGLREFIQTAEMDELKKMIDTDPEYYYHILAFAIVLGLEHKWARKFDSLTVEPPSWYVGSYSVWNAMVVSSMLSRCNSSLTSAMVSVPSSSPGSRFGGSSFGGGGFSGGGFGGGGGGAW